MASKQEQLNELQKKNLEAAMRLAQMSIENSQRIMEIQPTSLHERVSVVLGSKNEVERVTAYHREAQ